MRKDQNYYKKYISKTNLENFFYLIITSQNAIIDLEMNNIKPNLKGKVDFIDYVISRRIKLLRIQQGFSQFQLADIVDVSIQQIRKYENGVNRISGGKLHKIAKFLKVPINYFFDNIDENEVISLEPYPVNEKDVTSLIDAFNSIKNHQMRKKIIEMIKIMASSC